MTRPKALKFTSEHRDFGRGTPEPLRYYNGIPARDLTAADIAELSDEQLKTAMGGADPLYVEPKPETRVEAKADEKPAKSP